MAIDRREDAGEFYPGGKTISTQPVKGGGDMKHEDFADVAKLPDRFNDTMIHDKLNEVIGLLKGPVAAFALTLALDVLLGAFSVQGAGVTAETAPKGAIFNDEPVVTNVVFDATGLATPEMVTNIVQDVSPVPDFSPSNATLVATIEATAPAPRNYTAVSNAAMNAVQPTNMPTLAWYPMKQWGENIYISGSEYINVSTVYHGTIAHRIFDGWYLSLSTDFWDQFSDVALSGSYNDLSNKPTIPTVPTNVSAFNNDAGYLTGYTESDPVWNAEKSDYATKADLSTGQITVNSAEYAESARDAYNANYATLAEGLRDGPTEIYANTIFSRLDAAATTNALQDAAIAKKQDKLPYPTNAIPYAAISGKPTTISGYGITDALKSDFASLTNNAAFTSAVAAVSPPTDFTHVEAEIETNRTAIATLSARAYIEVVSADEVYYVFTTNQE